jgi:hypothetical protein
MDMTPKHLLALICAMLFIGLTVDANAQATRTWVSGVGDDANPCSRTAPCKTFAGAMSKTAAAGEIDVLDPGGYGAVTITKSITIDGTHGSGFGGILNSGVAGIIVAAGAGDTVILRNLSIDGAGLGAAGIRILSAQNVHVENVHIWGNSGGDPQGRGISDVRTTTGSLFIDNSVVEQNSQSGIVLQPQSGALVDASIKNVRAHANGNAGLVVLAGVTATVKDSVFAGNNSFGVYVEGSGAQAFLVDSSVESNYIGLYTGSGSPALLLSNVVVTANNLGIVPSAGSSIYSYANNKVAGNGGGQGPYSPGLIPVGNQ